MAKKYLDYDGLLYFWQSIKSLFVADVTYDSSTNYIKKTKGGQTTDVVQLPSGVSPSTTTPKMDGTAATGIETAFARGDHVHPTDTSRASSSHVHGYLANNGTFGGQSSAIEIANGDYLIIGDASVSGKKLAYSNLKFDASTDTKALTKKGTWETFSKDGEANVLEGVQMNSTDLTITNKKVNIPVFTGATSSAAGTVGLVPAPSIIPSSSSGTHYCLSASGSFTDVSSSFSVVDGSVTYLGFGGTFTQAIPEASVTWQNNGLMSLSDKTKLDSISMTNGIIDSSCLPSFVDDVIEAYARANQTELGSTWLATESATGTVITPEAGKIYVLMNSSTNYEQNTQFRWGGTAYVQLNDSGCTAITNSEIDTILAP